MKISKQIVSIISLMILISFPLKTNADETTKSLKNPIPLVFGSDLCPDKTALGTKVFLVAPETITYKKMVLKKDTTLIGTVKKFKKSKRYRKNGYFEIAISAINHPDDGLMTLKTPIDVKIYAPEIMHRKSKPAWMKTSEAILFCSDCAIGGTSLPLYLYENFKWDETIKNKSKSYKWGNALSKTLVVYYIYDFFKKYPDPNYTQGSEVKIKFKKKFTKKIFTQKETVL